MNKSILSYLLFFLIISCKKKEINNFDRINSSEYFSIATDLKNLKELKKQKINDSLDKVTGIFSNYEITGFINHKSIKLGWWTANSKKTKGLNAKLEYKYIDKKEFVNQYILYDNSKIDSSSSKFYYFDRNRNVIKYSFNIPNNSKKLDAEGKLNYHIYLNGTELKHSQSKCLKNENIYICELSYPKDIESEKIVVRGNFWELFQMENGNMGENEIYILDTLNLKYSNVTLFNTK